MFGLFRARRRRALLGEPFPRDWETALRAHVAFLPRLPPDLGQRVRAGARILVAEKNWEGCGGLDLTDPMKAVVAAQAALLLAGADGPAERNWTGSARSPACWSIHRRTG